MIYTHLLNFHIIIPQKHIDSTTAPLISSTGCGCVNVGSGLIPGRAHRRGKRWVYLDLAKWYKSRIWLRSRATQNPAQMLLWFLQEDLWETSGDCLLEGENWAGNEPRSRSLPETIMSLNGGAENVFGDGSGVSLIYCVFNRYWLWKIAGEVYHVWKNLTSKTLQHSNMHKLKEYFRVFSP